MTNPIVVSQRHLSLFEQCPRRYQAEILERRELPIESNGRQALDRGQRFHHLLQQRALGLTVGGEDPQLDRWLDRLAQSAIATDDPSKYHLAEHTRILALPPFELLVRYDALLANASGADIIDWKTYARPRQAQKLTQNWQTRLYRYVLAATSDYPPDRIAMVYWFAESREGEASNIVRLPYSAEGFDRDRHEIADLLERLARCRAGAHFPRCRDLGREDPNCACLQLADEPETDAIALPDFDDIEEVAIELG
ncbi:MAG: PD-(D/E)XK nuclease family protein [Geitlerinemataceae cyanobacterium]